MLDAVLLADFSVVRQLLAEMSSFDSGFSASRRLLAERSSFGPD
jgi:hypothetical protein